MPTSKIVSILSLLAFTTLLACGQETEPTPAPSGVMLTIQGLSLDQIDRVVVTAQPSGVSATLTRTPPNPFFQGTLTLPEGQYVLTAEAFTADPSQPAVASGSANVTVTAGATSAVMIYMLDPAPDPGQQTLEPIIKSLTASNANPLTGEAITLTSDVVHPTGATITYAWTSTCTGGTFSDASAATTTWTGSAAGTCALTLTASVADKSVTSSVSVTVQPSPGTVNTAATYVPRPYITKLTMTHFSGGTTYNGVVTRGAPGSQTPGNFPPMPALRKMQFQIETNEGWVNKLLVTCNGTSTYATSSTQTCGTTTCFANFFFNSALPGSVCLLTATSSREYPGGALTDTFSAGVRVQ
ncbi:hypothetical protein [Stigmatella hybrida]|uniref:hypothetical protein n=1 Tax=Stigmatella hybrida TaxID=394097 RepID=UPI001CDB0883|nr:hypothetical protein [Stigmatella hybrida]